MCLSVIIDLVSQSCNDIEKNMHKIRVFCRESSSDPLSPSGILKIPRATRRALWIFKIPSGHRGSRRRFPPKNPNLLYLFFQIPSGHREYIGIFPLKPEYLLYIFFQAIYSCFQGICERISPRGLVYVDPLESPDPQGIS